MLFSIFSPPLLFPKWECVGKKGSSLLFGHRKHQMWPGRLFMTSFSFRIFLFRRTRTDIHVRQFCSLVGVMAICFVGPMLFTCLWIELLRKIQFVIKSSSCSGTCGINVCWKAKETAARRLLNWQDPLCKSPVGAVPLRGLPFLVVLQLLHSSQALPPHSEVELRDQRR